MTREEAIYELGEWLEQMIQHGVPSHSAKRKALAMAIVALSEQVTGKLKNPCDSLLTDDSGGCKEHKSKLDLISRQDAIIVMACEMYASAQLQEDDCSLEDFIPEAKAWMNDCPSARPKGEWIVERDGNGWNDWENFTCPVCGEKFEKVVNRRKYKFCSNCGADMRGEEE